MQESCQVMSGKSVKRNYIYNVAYQILVLVTPLVTTPYVSRVLGADNIGKVSYESSAASYFVMLAALGTGLYGSREISYMQGSLENRTKVFWNIAALRGICSFVSLFVYILYAFEIRNGNPLCLIMAVSIATSAIDITWFFQGMEDFSRIIVKNLILKIADIVFIFVFVNSRDDILLYALSGTLMPALAHLSLWPSLRTAVEKRNVKDIRPFSDFKVILSLFIPTIAVSIYTILDKIIIGLVDSSGFENGYYEQAVKISKMTLTLLTALGTVMVPRIGNCYMHNEMQAVRRYMYRSYRFAWFLGIPLCLGVIGISDNLVPWFFGDGYHQVAVLLKVLPLLIPAIGISNVTGVQYLIPTQRQNLFTATVIIGSAANMALNAVFVPKLFAMGAALASVITEMTVAVIQLILVRKELHFQDIAGHMPKYASAGMVMLAAVRIENFFFCPSVVNTAVMISSGAAVYGLMLLILRDDFFISYLKMIIRMGKDHRKERKK